MKKILFILSVCLMVGCTHLKELKPGMIYVNETQIEGIDLSLPIPFMEDVYILEFKFGLIQNKHCKAYKVNYTSGSLFKDINLLTGSGTVSRSLGISDASK